MAAVATMEGAVVAPAVDITAAEVPVEAATVAEGMEAEDTVVAEATGEEVILAVAVDMVAAIIDRGRG